MNARRADSGTTDVRSAILEAATRLFEERGPDGLSMRQIAAEIGYSPTTIYLHFADKRELMLAVCSAGFDEFGAELEAAARAESDWLERFRATGRAYVDFALRKPMHYDVMFIRPKLWMAAWQPGPDAQEPASFAGMVALTEAAMAAGALRPGDPREAASLTWAALHGPVSLHLTMGDQMPGLEPDEVRARALRLLDLVLGSLT